MKKQILTNYNATFLKWTDDPGIALCECDDGQTREIPACCLVIPEGESLPKQDTSKAKEIVKKCGFYMGIPSNSEK